MNPIAVSAVSAAETRVFVLPWPGRTARSRDISFVLEPQDGTSRPLVRVTRYLTPEEDPHARD